MIRAATEADAPAIAAIWNHYIRETLVTFNATEKSAGEVAETIRAREASGQATFVKDDGEVIGFASYFQFRGGIGYARTMEHTVLLAPGAERRGAGRALMAAIEEHAAKAGNHSLFAGVSSGNAAGRAFHARLGYIERATLPEVGYKWDRWLDLHLMQKILSPGGDGQ